MEETKTEKNYNWKTKTREASREIHDKRTESRKEFLNNIIRRSKKQNNRK